MPRFVLKTAGAGQSRTSAESIESSVTNKFKWSAKLKLRNFQGTLLFPVNASSEVTLKLSTNMTSSAIPIGLASPTPASESNHFLGIAVLKSMLQKAIRRRLPEKAVKLADRLMRLSMVDFLRRIPVICIEDSLLHPALPILLWLMIAVTKGFALSQDMVDLCLRIVREIASCPHRDHPCHANDGSQADSSYASGNDMPATWLSLLSSMLLRASYGGMAGDIDMMVSTTAAWRQRLHRSSTGTCPSRLQPGQSLSYLHDEYLTSLQDLELGIQLVETYTKNEVIESEAFSSLSADGRELVSGNHRLSVEDIVPEGIDHICDWQLVGFLTNKHMAELRAFNEARVNSLDAFDRYAMDEAAHLDELVKSAIWMFSSSSNMRQLWPYSSQESRMSYESSMREDIVRKKKLAGVWKIIAASLSEYRKRKLSHILSILCTI
jgi:hypothetical protein